MHLLVSILAVSLAVPSASAAWPKGVVPFATATLKSTNRSNVSGTVDFAKAGKNTLLVRVYVENLAAGPHGFHIHENGDCSAADGSSAGDHWNPTKHTHSGPKVSERHQGDLGNLVVPTVPSTNPIQLRVAAPKSGTAWEEIVGKAIVIHAKEDDLRTDPSGNSGERIACGEIRALTPGP